MKSGSMDLPVLIFFLIVFATIGPCFPHRRFNINLSFSEKEKKIIEILVDVLNLKVNLERTDINNIELFLS